MGDLKVENLFLKYPHSWRTWKFKMVIFRLGKVMKSSSLLKSFFLVILNLLYECNLSKMIFNPYCIMDNSWIATSLKVWDPFSVSAAHMQCSCLVLLQYCINSHPPCYGSRKSIVCALRHGGLKAQYQMTADAHTTRNKWGDVKPPSPWLSIVTSACHQMMKPLALRAPFH